MFHHPATLPTVHIGDGGATPTLGQSSTLTCNVSGANVTTYQWRRDGSVLHGETTEMVSFSPLRLSNVGRYTCNVIVNGVVYSDEEYYIVTISKIELYAFA